MPRLASDLASTFAASRSGPIGSTAVRQGLQQRGAHAEIGVDRGELGPDHAAADHRDPLGQFAASLLVAWSEVTIRSPSMSRPGSDARHRTGADDHGLAAQRLTVDRHRAVGVSVPSPSITVDLAPLEQAGQALVQLSDDAALALVAAGPVRLAGPHRRGSLTPSRRRG